MTLFERVSELSKKRGFSSLKTLSAEAGLGLNAIYQWRNHEPGMKSLKAVADVLGVSVDYLLGNTDEMHPAKTDENGMPTDLEEVLSQLGPKLSFQGRELTDDQKLKLYEMAKVMFGD